MCARRERYVSEKVRDASVVCILFYAPHASYVNVQFIQGKQKAVFTNGKESLSKVCMD